MPFPARCFDDRQECVHGAHFDAIPLPDGFHHGPRDLLSERHARSGRTIHASKNGRKRAAFA